MTVSPDFPPKLASLHQQPRLCLFLAYPGMGLLDMTGPLSVFSSAAGFLEAEGSRSYVLHVVSLDGGAIVTAEGVTLETLPVAQFDDVEIDTVVIAGAKDMALALSDRRIVTWVADTAPRARRTASICAGAFLLADAGVLDGRRAATHWASCQALAQGYDKLTVEPDAIFVQDGAVWTSAGVSAGIDLALALVEDDCGHEITMRVARQLVIYIKRPGGQSQFSELLRTQASETTAFDELHVWITEHLHDSRLNVDALANHVGMSPRSFTRNYKAKMGQTPGKAIEFFRLEAARRLLEDSEQSIDQIAQRCGFGDKERMRTTFQRHLAVSPNDYRQRFSTKQTRHLASD